MNKKKSPNNLSRSIYLPLIFSSLFGALIYSTCFDLKLFGDDFPSWRLVEKTESLLGLFYRTYNPEFYRPFELLLIKANICITAKSTAFYHFAAISGHLGCSIMVFFLAGRLRLSAPVALLASLFFSISNVNAMAVLGNDSAGQIFSSLFGMAAIILLLSKNAKNFRNSILPLALLLISLLWKDTGVSYVLASLVIIALKNMNEKKIKAAMIQGAPILFLFATYLIFRKLAGIPGPDFGTDGRYQMWFGLNAIYNLALFIAAMITPIGAPTLLAMETVPQGVFAIVMTIFPMTIIGFGLIHFLKKAPEKRDKLVMPAMLFISLLLPALLLNRVSELYVYKSYPLFLILFAAAVVRTYVWTVRKTWWKKLLLASFLVLFIAANIFSIKQKELLMRVNGERANWILKEIEKAALPINKSMDVIVVDNHNPRERSYSVFYMRDAQLIGAGEFFKKIYGHKLKSYSVVSLNNQKNFLASTKTDALVIKITKTEVIAKIVGKAVDF